MLRPAIILGSCNTIYLDLPRSLVP